MVNSLFSGSWKIFSFLKRDYNDSCRVIQQSFTTFVSSATKLGNALERNLKVIYSYDIRSMMSKSVRCFAYYQLIFLGRNMCGRNPICISNRLKFKASYHEISGTKTIKYVFFCFVVLPTTKRVNFKALLL